MVPFRANPRERTVAPVMRVQLHSESAVAPKVRPRARAYRLIWIDLLGATAVAAITLAMTTDFVGSSLMWLLVMLGVF
jgi:hypothetical protein